ncbi:MAG TPA: sigma-70 family RNA polymerase sigma factor [Bryobacteraceae bacterium]|nr:sigma-70 family RNA polymerase sigma factor [Bryobacteraceae bacterium]
MTGANQNITLLLVASSAGDRHATDQLMPLVYDELRSLARAHLRRERPGHTLQGTALVHEAYLRLVDQKQVKWQNRAHFFGMASQMIRRILVDHARGHKAAKRGSGAAKLSLDEAILASAKTDVDVIALDDALNDLAKFDPGQSRIVELRFFGGLSIEETAEAVGLSVATINREWSAARAWLFRHVTRGPIQKAERA